MLRAALAEMFDRASKEAQGLLVLSLTADHAAVRGINIAQRNVIIRVAKDGLRLLKDAPRFAKMAFLKQQPAFQHAHDRRHSRKPERHSQFASYSRAF